MVCAVLTCMAGVEYGSEIAKLQVTGGARLAAMVQEGKLCVRSSSSPSAFGAADLEGEEPIKLR